MYISNKTKPLNYSIECQVMWATKKEEYQDLEKAKWLDLYWEVILEQEQSSWNEEAGRRPWDYGAWAESVCMFDEQWGRQSSCHLVTMGRITAKEVGEEATDFRFLNVSRRHRRLWNRGSHFHSERTAQAVVGKINYIIRRTRRR